LHGAAFYGHPEAARILIEKGAEIDIKNNGGYTPFLSACAGGKLEAASLLIEHGADLNALTADSNSALQNALWNNSVELAILLAEKGADVDILNQQGISPLYFAVAYRDKEISDLLIGRGTKFDITNEYNMTMLHYAAARGYLNQVEILIDKGIDVNAGCINGKTALFYAELWGHDSIVEYLRSKGADENASRITQFAGEYLGQKKPGKIPEIFTENSLLTPFAPHGAIVFSPDGNELFWCHQAMPIQAMWYMKRKNDLWQRPVIAPFTDPVLDYADGRPCFSVDGKRIYFHSHRPLVDGGERKEDLDIWYVEKTESGYGDPVNIGSPINTDNNDFHPTISEKGNIYYIASGYDDSFGQTDIYLSELKNGKYSNPVNLGSAVNSESHELTPVIAPDESYIIFASTRPNLFGGRLNLYATFRQPDGSWTEAIDLGRMINSETSWHPFISADGKFIFYLQGDQYKWLSSEVIFELKEAMVGTSHIEAESITPVSFRKSEQYFEPARTNNLAIGDLDGDGDLDAVFSNMAFNDSRVWLNDGKGHFTATEQLLTQLGHGVDIGDLDDDGDLDIFITCADYGENNNWNHLPSKIYFNDGKANFTDSGQNLGDSLLSGNGVTLHDIDTDGDLDAMINYYQESNLIYLNDGSGNFSKSDFTFPDNSSWCDLDSDGDVDILVRDLRAGFRTLLNDGKGNFSEHWQFSDSATVRGRIGFADLDNDGDSDAIVVSGGNENSRPSFVWYNDGTGRFSISDIQLPITRWARIEPGDLNSDGYLDIFISNFGLPNYIWLNDGKGTLYESGLRLGGPAYTADVFLIDLDDDGDLDVFLSNFGDGPNEIWLNELK
jgi:ankyrin repeat protein